MEEQWYLLQPNAEGLRAGLSGDRIPVGARFSAPVQTGPGAHPASCTMGTKSFPGVKSGQGVRLTPHPHSSAVGHERVELYLYNLYGPYGLYRASVPVQGCTLRAGRSGDRILVKARFSAPVQTGPGAHPASCTMGTESFPGVKSVQGVTLTLHPILVPLVMKE